MAWEIVPVLEDLRLQLNEVAPDRDKTSDGGIGNTSHAARRSSHNPDKTGSPEYKDGDSKDEIRARDFDKDLNRSDLTMEMVCQHLVQGARTGRFWWLRYIIFNRRIWSKSSGWVTRSYNGTNPHDKHMHVNSDFTQAADNYTGADYGLEELVGLTAADRDWFDNMVETKVKNAIRDQIGDIAEAVASFPVDIETDQPGVNKQPWANVDAYGRDERHRAITAAIAAAAAANKAVVKLDEVLARIPPVTPPAPPTR